MKTLIDIEIPKGWSMLYDPSSKIVYGMSEFKSGAKANTSLSVLTKETKAELLAEIETMGLSYTPPADQTPPQAQ